MNKLNEQGEVYQAIPSYLMVKSYQYGNVIEMTDAPVGRQVIQVLPGRKYKILETGQIKSMKKQSQKRSDNLKSVKATMARLRRLIGANFQGGKSELWITLTYAHLMTSPSVVYRDFKVFMQRLRAEFSNTKLEYISCLEPQASGSFHLHVLLKRKDHEILYIQNNKMFELWRHGFTKTNRLRQSDNVASYLMAYLTDLALNSQEQGKPTKQIAKGARLHLYPAHTKIYRSSRGIRLPTVKRDYKGNILATNHITNDADQRYKRSYQHDDHDFIITTEFYNLDKKGDRKL